MLNVNRNDDQDFNLGFSEGLDWEFEKDQILFIRDAFQQRRIDESRFIFSSPWWKDLLDLDQTIVDLSLDLQSEGFDRERFLEGFFSALVTRA